VVVLIGPARSGKTHRLLQEYRDVLRATAVGHLGQTLWLSPTAPSAAAIRAQILGADLAAVLEPGIGTFEGLANRVLARLLASPQRMTPILERELLRRVVDRARAAQQLSVFAEAARRSSFIDLVDEHISELKRRGISPAAFAKAIGLRGDRAQHEALSWLYTDYERLLETYGLTDSEGRLSALGGTLATGAPLGTHLRLVVADGFTDFTHTQHEILRRLAERTDRLCITLPGEEDSTLRGSSAARRARRADLFAKSAATLAELRRHHPRLSIEPIAARNTSWPALDYLASNIFCPPRDVAAPSSATLESLDRVEIVAAAGAQDEVSQIARRIKQRVVSWHVRPEDIVVVFRSLHELAPRVREVFQEFGIPHWLESRRPLIDTGVLRTLIDLLCLETEDWPFRRLVAVVTNNLLSIFDRRQRAQTEWLVRDLQIAESRQALLDRVLQLARTPSPTQRKAVSCETPSVSVPAMIGDHQQRRGAAASVAGEMLGELACAFDELPELASATDWCSALERLGSRLGIVALTAPVPSACEHSDDAESSIAWQRVVAHFTAIERLAGWLGESPPRLSRGDVLQLLLDVASQDKLPEPHDAVGCIRVLSAATARGIEAKHLFLAGMSEQAFPSPERVGRLYSESDYQAFQNVADQSRAESSPGSVSRSQEEMLLFYEVLTRATEQLTISYSGLDEKAQDLPPSSYVTELERLFEGEATIRRIEPQLAPISPKSSPLCPSEWRVHAIEHALQPEHHLALLAGLISEPSTRLVARSIDAALRAHAMRTNIDAFGPADGLLVSPTIRARLARRFGPQHLWSPSQWEHYAGCPFRSLLGDVLQLEPLGELTLETDALRRGSLLHRVLAEVHRELRNREGNTATFSQRDQAGVAAAFQRALEAELGATSRAGLDGALEELDRRQIAKWSEQYIEQHGEYDSAWQALDQAPLPTYFEFRFGPPRAEEHDGEDPRSTAEPFRLQLGTEEIRITGRIDRVDVGQVAGQSVFNVIDYKTGRRPTLTVEKMESGERLQPPLYVMAAQALLFGGDQARPLWAGYWSMDKGMTTDARFSLKCSAEGAKASEEWKNLQQSVVARIRQFVTDIRAGSFPVFSRDEQCTSYCQFSTVCRVSQVRSLGKQWTPDLNPEP
jgi:ATP-dependent helicase/DNAse subunit B